jgi:mRNA-degrading endonuclease RelE of RelBE toxin-antitoxin system
LTASADRQLSKIPPRIVPALIGLIYGPLAENPRRVGKPLGRAFDGSFSAHRSTYRVVYDIDEANSAVFVLRVAHRADVYRP